MKFDLSAEVFDEATKKLVAIAGQVPSPTPLKKILSTMLLNGVQDERASGDEKLHRYNLLRKIGAAVDAGEKVDLTIADIEIIKGLADKTLPTLFYGRLTEILNNPIADAS